MDTRVALGSSSLPMVGFGTYQIEDDLCVSVVEDALKAGYRHIDTAEFYGNHVGCGKAIKNSGVPREDIFVTTKLGAVNMPDFSNKTYDQTIESLNTDIKDLGLDYVDLFLIHSPHAKEERINQWKALVQLQKDGLCKEIGVSNYNEKHLTEIIDAGLPMPVCNQIELHPLCLQTDLVNFCKKHNILCCAYSSLAPASSWRKVGDVDQPSLKSDEVKKQIDGSAYNDTMAAVLAKHSGSGSGSNVSEAQVLLKWAVQKGFPILPKSTNPLRIRANADLFSFTISDEDMDALDKCDQGSALAWHIGNPILLE